MKATVNVLSDGPEYLPVLALNSYYIKEGISWMHRRRCLSFQNHIRYYGCFWKLGDVYIHFDARLTLCRISNVQFCTTLIDIFEH